MRRLSIFLVALLTLTTCRPKSENPNIDSQGRTRLQLQLFYDDHTAERQSKEAQCFRKYPPGAGLPSLDCQAAHTSSIGHGED